MQIIPAINCEDFECVKAKLQKAADFLPAGGWVQLDIADGKFTKHKTWNSPLALSSLISHLSSLNIEVHLMVENPLEMINDWVEAGVKRIIVHLEAFAVEQSDFLKLRNRREAGLPKVEIGLAINPKTSVKKVIPYISANQQKIGVT